VFQFQLADRSHELILEITALRAQIAEMREDKLRLDLDIRDDVRRDYQVRANMALVFETRAQFR